MNLKVFPIGYYAGYLKSAKEPIQSMSLIYEMKKGIWNGSASITINEQRICRTNFSD